MGSRREEYKNSDLPYSFSYKIRKAFYGERCPVCNAVMNGMIDGRFFSRNLMPSIQHNVPIALGGKHELSNISVICSWCNSSIGDHITGKLNNDLVVKKWGEINGRTKNVCENNS